MPSLEPRTIRQATKPAGSPVPLLLIGGICGLAWAASLRGLMTQIAGSETTMSWSGTFGWVLLPGIGTGALLGWAEHLRRTGGRRGWRWLALSPLLFASVLLTGIVDSAGFFEGGVGGGAIGVPVYCMVGGYALSGRGPSWARIVCGLVFLTAIPIWAFTAVGIGGPAMALTTPRGAWVALHYWSLLAVLALACAIPHRRLEAT